MSADKAKTRLFITDRALRDIAEIEAYSVAEWGRPASVRYIEDIEAALARIQEKPNLLRPEENFHPKLSFYRVNQHLLCCDRHSGAVFLLTVIHTSRDIPSRLAELAPTLAAESELLHQQLKQRRKR